MFDFDTLFVRKRTATFTINISTVQSTVKPYLIKNQANSIKRVFKKHLYYISTNRNKDKQLTFRQITIQTSEYYLCTINSFLSFAFQTIPLR